MTVFVLIPVFNRLHHTQKVIEVLRAQTIADNARIIVIDDGSTDGTDSYLKMQEDVITLKGDGNLWWGGAIECGLQYVLDKAKADDYVLFLNNDTWFGPDYMETLVNVSRMHGGAAVGSVVHEEGRDIPLVSIGPRLDINRLLVWDVIADLSLEEKRRPKKIYEVDALSGRGALYPISLFRRYGSMRPRLLPHYLGDYEIAMRFARKGVPLLASSEAVVFSPSLYGSEVSGFGWWDRLFSRRSPTNVIRLALFFMLVGSPWQRFTALGRMARVAVRRTNVGSARLRKKM
jgi:GT2 family glycosyltransferase